MNVEVPRGELWSTRDRIFAKWECEETRTTLLAHLKREGTAAFLVAIAEHTPPGERDELVEATLENIPYALIQLIRAEGWEVKEVSGR